MQRGWRWMFWLTGLPGWARFDYPGYYRYPAPFGFWSGWVRGNPFGFCRWFPWLPRWWWTGMYGPVQCTPQGPVLTSQVSQQTQPIQLQMSKEEEINYLEQELKALEEERNLIEQEIDSIKKRLEELER